MDARGKFGEHERCVRFARGDKPSATLASWVLSKPPKCIQDSVYAQLKAWTNSFITERHQGSAQRSFFYCDRAKNSHNAQKSKQTCLLAGQKHATCLFKFKFAKRATYNFFRLYFYCSLDQDLKSQCRWKNWAVLRWFLPYFKEKENCTAA